MSPELDLIGRVYDLLVRQSRVPGDAWKIGDASHGGSEEPGSRWGVVRDMARAASDPHTILLAPEAMTALQSMAGGAAVPMPGFALHRVRSTFVVGEVVPGSPAERAGLVPGDAVVSLGGAPVFRGMEDMLLLLGRRAGSELPVEVLRGGVQRVVRIVLGAERLPLAGWRLLPGAIGYVRLRFVTASDDPEGDGASLVERALDSFEPHAIRGLVLDLRSNPGGYGVGRVASVLTDRDPIIVYRDAAGRDEITRRAPGRARCHCPIVVLVDEQTMSSAEMITLSLQEHGVARVVGEPTAGALTVPRYVPLGEGFVLMVPDRFAVGPVTRRVLPGLRITPELVVPNRTPEDFAAGRDPQLEAALEVLERHG